MAPISVSDIQAEAELAGFALLGILPPVTPAHYPEFLNWLDQGLHAGMDWISKPHSIRLRADPSLLLQGGRSLISLAAAYPPSLMESSRPGYARAASYACFADYHRVLPGKLKDLGRKIALIAGEKARMKTFVDSSPLLERDLASMSGLGWIGKNTCLISPELGSYLLLGEILMDIELPRTAPFEADRCGSCRKCIEACPTGCIRPDRMIDSSRCISYLTIEHQGEIPAALRPLIGDWIFGCDICQMVCPWNQKPNRQSFPCFPPGLLDPAGFRLKDELQLSQERFTERYSGLPIQRSGWENHIRNALICAGNSRDEDLIPIVGGLIQVPSALIRSHAAWVLGRFHIKSAQQILEKSLMAENAESVTRQIRAALEEE